MNLPLQLPKSRDDIRKIQSERKRIAFERAKKIPWYRGKLDHIDPAKLDDPEHWRRIPILDKETLRQLDHAEFLRQFCCVPATEIAEYWRSGGSTGTPVFYPRTHEDIRYGLLAWGRSFPCMGIGPGDLCHIAFPIGIHPAGQVWARSAHLFEVGMIWVGAGNAHPSAAQLDLIQQPQMDPAVMEQLQKLTAPYAAAHRNGSCAPVAAPAAGFGKAKACDIARLNRTAGTLVQVHGQPLVLFAANGRVVATQALCPHAGAPLQDAAVKDGCLICPVHNYGFDLTTGRCDTDPRLRLETYPTSIEDGAVWVELAQPQITVDHCAQSEVSREPAWRKL